MDKKSFTLIELVLVVALLSILVALSAPQLKKSLSNFELDNFAKEIYFLSRSLQASAIAERRIYCLNLDSRKDFFWVTRQDKDEFKAPIKDYSRNYKLPKGLNAEFEPPDKTEVYFYPDGTTDKVTIIFKNQLQKQISLIIQGSINGIQVK